MGEEVVEEFRPTSGRISGFLAIAFALLVVVVAALPGDQGIAPYVVWGVLFAGVLAWAAMVRPRLWATESDLVMRNTLSTFTIPLAAIEAVAVRQVCAVRAGRRRYVSPVVGMSVRQINRKARASNDVESMKVADIPYATHVEDRIHHLAELARMREGINLMSDEQVARASGVRREWAYPEIAALAVTALGFVVTLVLAL